MDYRYLTIKVDKEDIETAMKAVRAPDVFFAFLPPSIIHGSGSFF